MLFPCMHLNPPKQHPSSDPNHVYLKGCMQVIQAFPNSVYERYTVFPKDDEQSLSYTLVQPVGYTTAQCCPLSVMLLELHSENPRSAKAKNRASTYGHLLGLSSRCTFSRSLQRAAVRSGSAKASVQN